MSLRPAGLGAEPKKVVALAAILVVGGGVAYWANQSDVPAGAKSGPTPSAPAVKTAVVPVQIAPRPASSTASRTSRGGRGSGSGDDFRPTLKLPEGIDLTRVDPTLKTNLLAKVREVSIEGGSRSLFEFYIPPPPPVPLPKPQPILPKPVTTEIKGPAPPVTPPKPPTLPIPLKFYGYSGNLRSNVRKAFFLDGEDIVQAGENDTIRNRYKIIRIGVNSALVEDIVAKNQQTLPLADEAQ